MAEETVLIIDDNLALLDMLEMGLSSHYTVVTASDGREGLRAVRQHNPDLVLLDMLMPRMGGMEMLETLRQTGRQTPVIFMTAAGSEHIAAQAFRLGVTDYLTKPFSLPTLRQVVRAALREQRLIREKEALRQAVAAAETVRQTMITLAHTINNQLTIIDGGLFLLQEQLDAPAETAPALLPRQIIRDSRQSVRRITRVLDTLLTLNAVNPTAYHANESMLDIETRLRQTVLDAASSSRESAS